MTPIGSTSSNIRRAITFMIDSSSPCATDAPADAHKELDVYTPRKSSRNDDSAADQPGCADERAVDGFGRHRTRRARAASRPRSQHGNLGHLLGRAEAVLDQ